MACNRAAESKKEMLFDADVVVHSKPELLLAAEVMLRCLHGYVTEKKLDLVELAAR